MAFGTAVVRGLQKKGGSDDLHGLLVKVVVILFAHCSMYNELLYFIIIGTNYEQE